jgi:hypothetical protein
MLVIAFAVGQGAVEGLQVRIAAVGHGLVGGGDDARVALDLMDLAPRLFDGQPRTARRTMRSCWLSSSRRILPSAGR